MDEVQGYIECEIAVELEVCCHYLLQAWRGDQPQEIPTHGHTRRRMLDVPQEALAGRPNRAGAWRDHSDHPFGFRRA